MCFSPEASFVAAAALVPSGIYCIQVAARKNRRLLAVAMVPLLFGIQQFCEGLVWLGLKRGDPELTLRASLAFLFPALALWPFWIPFMMWLKETHPLRRRLLFGLTALSTAWFWMLWVPIVQAPEVLTIQIEHHSIAYRYTEVAAFRYLPPPLMNLLYGLTVTLPLLLNPEKRSQLPSLVIAVTAVIGLLVYRYAFVSVWCFFAAILAVYLVWVFNTLPEQAEAYVAKSTS